MEVSLLKNLKNLIPNQVPILHSCGQDSLPEFAGNPISTVEDIILAKLGPGQVRFFHDWLGGVNLSFTSSCNIFGKEVV
jgi:hypothetical protein